MISSTDVTAATACFLRIFCGASNVLGAGEGIWSLIWHDKAVGAESKKRMASLPGWDWYFCLLPRGACGTILSVLAVLLPREVVLGQQPQLKWGWHFPWCRRLVFILLVQGWVPDEGRGKGLCGYRWKLLWVLPQGRGEVSKVQCSRVLGLVCSA